MYHERLLLMADRGGLFGALEIEGSLLIVDVEEALVTGTTFRVFPLTMGPRTGLYIKVILKGEERKHTKYLKQNFHFFPLFLLHVQS